MSTTERQALRLLLADQLEHTAATLGGLREERQLDAIAAAAGDLATRLLDGGKALLFGNGGSAAQAQHLAAELAGRFRAERTPLAAMALTSNSSSVTAIANDYGYRAVFARQVAGLGVAGDVAIGLTTSGRSENVLGALEQAGSQGLMTILLTGSDAPPLEDLVDHCLRAPSADVGHIQEAHLVIGHLLCGVVEQELLHSD